VRTRLYLFALLAALFCASFPSKSRELKEDFFCGNLVSIPGYSISVLGRRFDLAANTIIRRGNLTLHRDEFTTKWEEPYSYAKYANANGLLLILSGETDCVDLHSRRVFIVLPNDQVIAQPIWTSNFEDGFFFVEKQLTYWSEWFCDDGNTERGSAKSYVYSLDLVSLKFEKRDVPTSLYCPVKKRPKFIIFKRPTITNTR
jgi:hypothetical protein